MGRGSGGGRGGGGGAKIAATLDTRQANILRKLASGGTSVADLPGVTAGRGANLRVTRAGANAVNSLYNKGLIQQGAYSMGGQRFLLTDKGKSVLKALE